VTAPARAFLIGAACLVGCAGPTYDFGDLPASPVAIVHRTMSESDKAYDQVLENEKFLRVRRTGRRERRTRWDQNRLDGDRVMALFEGPGERALAALGRMALVDPRTGAIEPAEWAKRGSRPLGWSQDRTRLLYLSVRRGEPHIFERNLVSGENTKLTHDRRRYLDAAYCGPEGLVTAGVDTAGRIQLHYREAQSGAPAAVTGNYMAYAPACSPDGKTIFFESVDTKGRAQIRSLELADPEGSLRTLARGRHPTATPDGAWIIFSAKTRDAWKLWRMRPDGTGRHPFGRGADWEHAPAVSPDGRYVVFIATDDERQVRQKLWVRPLDGEDDRPLRVDGDALHPAW
jgi:Tol biopolymer transport system component